MEVYLVDQDNMTRVVESELDREAKLEQRLVRTDGAKIGDVEVLYVGRQGSPGEGGVFDILGVDERGDTVVVELKRGRTPRDVVAQALEYAGEIRNVDYHYLDDRYREFLREEQGYSDPSEMPSLREAHQEYFDLEDPLSEREFNDDQRLVVVGTDFGDVVLNMSDFLRENGIDVVAVEYSTYRDEEEGVELLTTDGVRRPLSEEPTTSTGGTSSDYPDLLASIRDRVFPDVKDTLDLEEREDVTTGGRELRFSSQAPGHPESVVYRFKQRLDNPDRVSNMDLILWGGSDDEKDRVRSVVSNYADDLEDYRLTEDYQESMVVLRRGIDLCGEEPDDEFIYTLGSELVDLIEFIHPKLAAEVETVEG